VKLQYLCHTLILALTAGFSLESTAADTSPPPAHDYPTLARVEYVNQCINYNGGKLAALYQCSCAIDRIADALSFDEFVEATTFMKNANMPGEGGGMFRDSDRGRKLVKSYRELENESLRRCGMMR